MTFNTKSTILLALALLGAAIAPSAATSSRDESHGIRLDAVAVNLSNVGRPGTTSIDLGIDRWTTDKETARLAHALQKGTQAAMEQLRGMDRVGFIRRSNGGLGWVIRYARRDDLQNGGYRIVFATDRPMSFYERVTRPRSAEYDLVVGEVRVGKDGHGEGKIVPMAKLSFNKDRRVFEIENYASEPVRLANVEVTSSSNKRQARRDP